MENRELLEILLRKNRDTLKIVGLGVIVFGAWSVVKTVLYTLVSWQRLTADISMPEEQKTAGLVIFLLMIALFLGAELLLRLYVGRSAIAEGRGKRRHRRYIVLAFGMTAFSGIVLILLFLAAIRQGSFTLDTVITGIVEFTSCITMLEMCLASIRVRKLSRLLAEEG